MNINDLPIEIFIKLFDNFYSIEECDIEFNLNLRLVCKYWNIVINKNRFFILYSKKIILNQNWKDPMKSLYDYVKILNNKIKKNIIY